MLARPLPDLAAWTQYLQTAPMPVLPETADELGLLAEAEIRHGNVDAHLINEACNELEKGMSLSQFFKGNAYIPPMLVQMIAVGEQSGELDKMLAKAADSYEREVEAKILALTSLIEPVMILTMGLVVSFIVVSILLPIFEMNQLMR